MEGEDGEANNRRGARDELTQVSSISICAGFTCFTGTKVHILRLITSTGNSSDNCAGFLVTGASALLV